MLIVMVCMCQCFQVIRGSSQGQYRGGLTDVEGYINCQRCH